MSLDMEGVIEPATSAIATGRWRYKNGTAAMILVGSQEVQKAGGSDTVNNPTSTQLTHTLTLLSPSPTILLQFKPSWPFC